MAVAAACVLAGCATAHPGSAPTEGATASAPRVTLPPISGGFDYQLGGAYALPRGVEVLTRDSTDEPVKGVYSICYVNGFQTQPGAEWPSALILHTATGAALVDPGWPDEYILDISTVAKRQAVAQRIQRSIAGCRRKGFEAVEFDNLDSYSRSKGALTPADAIAYARLLVAAAHEDGLAASQKNTAELAGVGKRSIGFDFVTTEECDRYSECGTFTKVYGAHVYDIEYTDNLRGTIAAVCARKTTPKITIVRDRDLVVPRSKGYFYRRC
jgi:hypothetical protein